MVYPANMTDEEINASLVETRKTIQFFKEQNKEKRMAKIEPTTKEIKSLLEDKINPLLDKIKTKSGLKEVTLETENLNALVKRHLGLRDKKRFSDAVKKYKKLNAQVINNKEHFKGALRQILKEPEEQIAELERGLKVNQVLRDPIDYLNNGLSNAKAQFEGGRISESQAKEHARKVLAIFDSIPQTQFSDDYLKNLEDALTEYQNSIEANLRLIGEVKGNALNLQKEIDGLKRQNPRNPLIKAKENEPDLQDFQRCSRGNAFLLINIIPGLVNHIEVVKKSVKPVKAGVKESKSTTRSSQLYESSEGGSLQKSAVLTPGYQQENPQTKKGSLRKSQDISGGVKALIKQHTAKIEEMAKSAKSGRQTPLGSRHEPQNRTHLNIKSKPK